MTRHHYIILWTLIGWFFGISEINAQQENQYFLLPKLNVAKKIKKDYKLNVGIESRQQLRTIDFETDITQGYEYTLTDVSAMLSKKTGLNNSFTAGYLMRFSDGAPSYRLIQQFAIVRRFNGFRLSHRFRTDQTFNTSENPVFRARYRLTPEIPLAGLAVDKKEFYLKINNEYVGSLEATTYDLEVRVVPMLGYVFKNKNKLEVGLDYRIDSFISNNIRQRFFSSINYYVNL